MAEENAGTTQPPQVLRPGLTLWRQETDKTESPSDTSHAPRVLILLFTWLFSKPSAAAKYAKLYTRKGFDVLQISSSLSHFLWPPNSKTFALEIVSVLRRHFSHYQHYVVHAMSIGAYNYTTLIMLASDRPETRMHFFSKLRACVMDSLTIGSLDHMIHGIATGASQRVLVRKATYCMANMYFALTRKTTVDAFNEGVDFFRQHPVQAPTLVFASKNDPMSDTNALVSTVNDWKVINRFPVTFQLWERSGHCAHLQQHSEEYVQVLDTFLTTLKLDSNNMKQKDNVLKHKSRL